jgi:hypothetical protein
MSCVHKTGYDAAYHGQVDECKKLFGKTNVNLFLIGASNFLENVADIEKAAATVVTAQSLSASTATDHASHDITDNTSLDTIVNTPLDTPDNTPLPPTTDHSQPQPDQPAAALGELAAYLALPDDKKTEWKSAAKEIASWSLLSGACNLFSFRHKRQGGGFRQLTFGKNISMRKGPGDIAKGSANEFFSSV